MFCIVSSLFFSETCLFIFVLLDANMYETVRIDTADITSSNQSHQRTIALIINCNCLRSYQNEKYIEYF